MKDVAEQLFRRYLEAHPDAYSTSNNLVSCVRDQGRGAEAIEILRTAAIKARRADPMLWNTLGTVLSEQGDHPTAILFFDEALRLDPDFAQARYNRGNAALELGEAEAALADCEAALEPRPRRGRPGDDAAGPLHHQDRARPHRRRLGRLRGAAGSAVRRRDGLRGRRAAAWTPESPMRGKTLLVMGEQGLGDEVLFANMLPEVVEALGPDGKLVLAVEERLVALFQRSFPAVEVVPHLTYRQHGRNFRAAPAAGRHRAASTSGSRWPRCCGASAAGWKISRRDRLPDPRPRPRGALARGFGRRAGRPQGRHPLEEHEGRVRRAPATTRRSNSGRRC